VKIIVGFLSYEDVERTCERVGADVKSLEFNPALGWVLSVDSPALESVLEAHPCDVVFGLPRCE